MKHLKNFNENNSKYIDDELEKLQNEVVPKDFFTKSNIDKIYQKYSYECLNSDGDFSMSFKDWLKENNYEIIKK